MRNFKITAFAILLVFALTMMSFGISVRDLFCAAGAPWCASTRI